MRNSVYGFILSICFCLISLFGNAQTVIQMEDVGGVYKIPCTVNGLKLKMIFDPGASNVCISESTAKMMLENDYLTLEDVIGTGQSQVADGSIVDHTIINLKKVQIGEKVLANIEAVVIHGQDAPLLFGQSALKKLGQYSISGNNLIIGANNSSGTSKKSVLSKAEIDMLIKEADKAFNDGAFYVAAEKYQILLDNGKLSSPRRRINYSKCLNRIGEVDKALELCLSMQSEVEKKYPNEKAELYYQIGILYGRKKETDLSLPYIEKAKYYAKPWSELQITALSYLESIYFLNDRVPEAIIMVQEYIEKYLKYRGWKPTDCWEKSITDEKLGRLYNDLAGLYYYDDEKYHIISAAWGNEYSREECEKRNLNYSSKVNMYKYSY